MSCSGRSRLSNLLSLTLEHALISSPPMLSCKDPMLFDLVSYCDARVQSNPFVLKGDKRVLVERAW